MHFVLQNLNLFKTKNIDLILNYSYNMRSKIKILQVGFNFTSCVLYQLPTL